MKYHTDPNYTDYSATPVFQESMAPPSGVWYEGEPLLDDDAVLRRARTAAMADLRSAEGDFFGHFDRMLDMYRTQIAAGQEEAIHTRNLRKRMEGSVSSVALFAQENPFVQTEEILAELFESDLASDATTEEASMVLQDLLGTSDPDELQLYEDHLDAFGVRTEIDRRAAKIHQVLEEAEADSKGRFPALWATDFLFSVIPFVDAQTRQGIVDTDAVTKRWYDFILSGQRSASEASALWMATPEEFDRLVEELGPQVRNSVTGLGYRNRLQELDVLRRINAGVNETELNLINALDNGPLLLWGATKFGRAAGKIPVRLAAGGNNSASAEYINRLSRIIEQEGEAATKTRLGEDANDVADAVLPTSINPAKAASDDFLTGPGAEAAKRYEMGKATAEEVIGQIEPLRLLNAEERLTAVTEITQRLQKTYGKKRIIDVRIANRTTGSGIESPVMIVRLGTSKGGRFANEQTLKQFLRREGFDPDYVKVEGTGPGLRKPKLRSADKDPVMQRAARSDELSDAGIRVNPSEADLKTMFLQSAGDPTPGVKGIVTPDGNTFFWRASEGTHVEVLTRGGISVDEVGRLHYAPGQKGAGMYDPKLAKDKQIALGAGDERFKFRTEQIDNPARAKVQTVVDGLQGKQAKLNQELEDLKLSLTLRNNLSGDTMGRTQNIQINQRMRAVEKELAANKKALREAEAELRQYPLKADIREEAGRGFYAEVEMPLAERGFFAPSTDVKPTSGFGRFLLGGRQLASEDVFGLSVQSVARRNALLSILNKEFAPTFRRLNKAERDALNSVIKLGEENAQWFDNLTLRDMYFAADISDDALRADRFIEAYRAYQKANDLEYMLRNDEMFFIKNQQGYQTVEVNTNSDFSVGARNGRVIRTLPTTLPTNARTYNANGRFHYVNERVAEYNAKQLMDDGYVMVEFDKPIELPHPNGSTYANRLVVRKQDLHIRPLNNHQINYRAGGHRMYHPSVKWFAKQGRIARQADTGDEFFTTPSTWRGAIDKGELKAWVDRHNQGLTIAQRMLDGEIQEATALKRLSGIVDEPEEFLNDVKSGYIDPKIPFEVVRDRDMPSFYTSIDRPAGVDFADELPGYLAHAETQGRMYYSPKGKPLLDPAGEQLPILNAYETQNRALSNVAQLIGFSTYKQRAIQKWLTTYGKYLDARGIQNDARTFLESTFKLGTPDSIQNAALQERDVIRRVLNWTTPGEMRNQTRMRNLIETFEEGNWPQRQTAKILNWTNETEFLSKLRGFVFDAKLGMFNVAQFPMQITTMLAATSIDPTNGMKALNALPWLRAHSAGKYSDIASLREAVGTKTFGFSSPEEFVTMADELRKGGFLNVNRSQVLINDLNSSNAFNLTGSKVSDIREAGRFFFYEAERWNRTVAFQMAWQRAAKKISREADPQGFLEEVYKIAEDLSLNMTEASAAQWQKGILSIPTQFWAYQQRMLEAVFGRQLTRAEKIRLGVGQFALYGSAGIPGIAYLSARMQGQRGDAVDFENEPVLAALDRGLIDTILTLGTGNETSFGERAGIGHFHSDIVLEFFNAGRYGESSTYDMVTGATGSVLADIGADTLDFFKVLAVEAGGGNPMGPVTRDHLNNIARNVSMYNNSYKAYMLWKYEAMISTKGNVLFSDGTKGDAFATFLGIPLGENRELSANMMWLKDRSKTVEDVARTIGQYRARLANEIGNSDDLVTEYFLYREMVDADIWQEALIKAGAYTSDATLDSIGRSITKRKLRERAADND